uniref:MIP18 family-like domain-containing protein n=1 Tax=Paramoeba aestuarina TaxID=180227 RepID=A0A7S4U8E8_9EUKA
MDNPNPLLRSQTERPIVKQTPTPSITSIDPLDVYDFIREIKDPEHPYTLEDLMVVKEELVKVKRDEERKIEVVQVTFVPTVPHCSLASLIALCIREKLINELPLGTKIVVEVAEGSHQNEGELNKQINDKERVHAALENPNLYPLIRECIKIPHM